jgi:hypothetical protein
MTSTQLYRHAEPNSTNIITMVVYNKQDHELVMARQTTLERELQSVLEIGEENKLFINPLEGIWFGGTISHKEGRLLNSRLPNKQELAHASLLNNMLNSPPKK